MRCLCVWERESERGVWVARYCVSFKTVRSNKNKHHVRLWLVLSIDPPHNSYTEDTKLQFIYSCTAISKLSLTVEMICCARGYPSGFGENQADPWTENSPALAETNTWLKRKLTTHFKISFGLIYTTHLQRSVCEIKFILCINASEWDINTMKTSRWTRRNYRDVFWASLVTQVCWRVFNHSHLMVLLLWLWDSTDLHVKGSETTELTSLCVERPYEIEIETFTQHTILLSWPNMFSKYMF